MTSPTRQHLERANYLVATLLIVPLSVMLIAPLFPAPGNRHGGLLSFFGGLVLLPLPILFFAAGRAIKRHSLSAWVFQILAVALVALVGWQLW